MWINNNRNQKDYAGLPISGWSGILVGPDEYPLMKYGCYCIAGGQNEYFEALVIEFYGVKTQT